MEDTAPLNRSCSTSTSLDGMRDFSPWRSAGYVPLETNQYGGDSFYRGTLPHDFGVVLLEKQ
jgi:hypothetical protein